VGRNPSLYPALPVLSNEGSAVLSYDAATGQPSCNLGTSSNCLDPGPFSLQRCNACFSHVGGRIMPGVSPLSQDVILIGISESHCTVLVLSSLPVVPAIPFMLLTLLILRDGIQPY
jgi:hypothetical protein